MDVKQLLMDKYGLQMPPAPKPVALYRPVTQTGNLLFLSGQTGKLNGKLQHTGMVGRDISVEDAKASARLAALNLLAVLWEYLDGNLERVEQIVQLTGYIRSAPGFDEQPAVMNGASELFRDVFADAGIAARAALGTNELPEGAPIEVLAVVALRDT